MGLRLAGIDGVVAHGQQEVALALDEAMEREDVAVILMTTIAVNECREKVMQYKLERPTPLIVEIPDRHLSSDVTAAVSQYLREAVGI